ncbi:MAG TPA: tRNA pseudouridine(55) synthase TruB [Actinomycetota bacterium]|nr:tRNA pseudouridine(55) synthase TruB [Actinomycetota bacterium]
MIGFVLVDKPPGPTSHDVVDAARRRLGTRKVGHAGTLDPPASGLVVLAVGPATRLLRFVQDQAKTYTATGVLGVRTSTLDAAGEVLSRQDPAVTEEQLAEAASRLRGTIQQVPPAVSAIKVGGERAYRRAARGEEVELEARTVTVYELTVTSFDLPRFGVEVTCSAGTYIRSLVADIGESLGCGAHVEALRRTSIGSLSVDDAVPPDGIGPADVLAVDTALRDLRMLDLAADPARRARSGQRLPTDAPPGLVLVRGPDGVVGVFESEDGILRPVTVLPPASGD